MYTFVTHCLSLFSEVQQFFGKIHPCPDPVPDHDEREAEEEAERSPEIRDQGLKRVDQLLCLRLKGCS